MSIGARLKALRIGRGESLQQVANAVGASKPHIWELEQDRSRNPSRELLVKLAAHFKVTVAYLIGEVDTPSGKLDTLVFGRDFSGASEETRKRVLEMAERLMDDRGDGRDDG